MMPLASEKVLAAEYFVREGYDDCMAALDKLISKAEKRRTPTGKFRSKKVSAMREQLAQSISARRSSAGTDAKRGKAPQSKAAASFSHDGGNKRFFGVRSNLVQSSLNTGPKVVMPWNGRSTLDSEPSEEVEGSGDAFTAERPLGCPGLSHVAILAQLTSDFSGSQESGIGSRRPTASMPNTVSSRMNSVIAGANSRRMSTAPTTAPDTVRSRMNSVIAGAASRWDTVRSRMNSVIAGADSRRKSTAPTAPDKRKSIGLREVSSSVSESPGAEQSLLNDLQEVLNARSAQSRFTSQPRQTKLSSFIQTNAAQLFAADTEDTQR
jgi:hypothetical protein